MGPLARIVNSRRLFGAVAIWQLVCVGVVLLLNTSAVKREGGGVLAHIPYSTTLISAHYHE